MAAGHVVRTSFERCLKAVDPRSAVRNAISISSGHLQILERQFPLSKFTKIIVISFGKASIQMASGADDILKSLQKTHVQKTLILAPDGQKSEISNESTTIWFGAKNNLPDENSVLSTWNLVQKIREFDSESTLFVFLISGGGSALLTAPIATVTLQEKLETIKIMQAHGATIQELNTVRQKLSDVKGGKLLRNIQKSSSISLIISDCIGNPIDLIASGPTVIQKENSTKTIAEILENLKIQETDLPKPVQKVLQEMEAPIPTTTNRFQNFIISSNSCALHAASEFLNSSGFQSTIVSLSLSGNATEIGYHFADLISSKSIDNNPILEGKILDSKYPLALLFGGETTVNLSENPGKGGRNQEMVLACLDSLKSRIPRFEFIFLSAGTDGQDGPTDAAGAIISNQDILNPMTSSTSEYLKNSDSWTFWNRFNGGDNHLITGPSGTNVMDIQILLLLKPIQ